MVMSLMTLGSSGRSLDFEMACFELRRTELEFGGLMVLCIRPSSKGY